MSYRWDNQPGVEPGWYVEIRDDRGDVRDDSQKSWFRVRVDEFGPDKEDELIAALRAAYPDVVVD